MRPSGRIECLFRPDRRLILRGDALRYQCRLLPWSAPFPCVYFAACREVARGSSLLCGGVCNPGWDLRLCPSSSSLQRNLRCERRGLILRQSVCRQRQKIRLLDQRMPYRQCPWIAYRLRLFERPNAGRANSRFW